MVEEQAGEGGPQCADAVVQDFVAGENGGHVFGAEDHGDPHWEGQCGNRGDAHADAHG